MLEVVKPVLISSKDVNDTIIKCAVRKCSVDLLPFLGRHAVSSLETEGEEYPKDRLITIAYQHTSAKQPFWLAELTNGDRLPTASSNVPGSDKSSQSVTVCHSLSQSVAVCHAQVIGNSSNYLLYFDFFWLTVIQAQ